MSQEDHFCTCPVKSCAKNPCNHDRGCDLCIQKNLANGEIPACFFLKVSPDVDRLTSFTARSFVDFYLEHEARESEEHM